jgi:hypothetical protein
VEIKMKTKKYQIMVMLFALFVVFAIGMTWNTGIGKESKVTSDTSLSKSQLAKTCFENGKLPVETCKPKVKNTQITITTI